MSGSMDDLTRDDYRDLTKRAFEYLYCKVNTFDDYVLKTNPVDEVTLDRFMDYVYNVGGNSKVHFILNFMDSSFEWYVKIDDGYRRYGLKSIKLAWIIGKPAIKRQEVLKANYPYFPKFLRFINTKVKADLWGKFAKENGTAIDYLPISRYIELDDNEEKRKAQCYNTEFTLMHCINNTFLYNHKSNYCVFCEEMKECKKKLMDMYPKIYEKRGY